MHSLIWEYFIKSENDASQAKYMEY